MSQTPNATAISLQKERLIRFTIWVITMCVASLITFQFTPHKVYLIPAISLVFFAPFVLIPLPRKGENPMPKTGRVTTVKLLWLWGSFVWCSLVAFVWWRGYESQTFAQASRTNTWVLFASGIGTLWSVAGGVWLEKIRKTRTT
jgi:hypothetical protein